MKNWFTTLFLLSAFVLNSQNDTLLFENFELDPSLDMLTFPTGNDTVWVNFDEDNELTNDPDAQQNWYSEYAQFDLPNGNKNNVFISVSWLKDTGAVNKNWLILPPIKLCDDKASIHWKSAPLEGPAFMDGYFLKISTSENDIDFFTTTLFGHAECIELPTSITTDPALFGFSPGYIHAKTFTDSQYFEYNGLSNLCKLEPHSYFLDGYANQTVYLAFLHQSKNDNRLDLDDILVLGNKCTTEIDETSDFEIEPILYPNPVDWQLNVLFSLKKAGFCQFSVVNELGRTVFFEEKKWFAAGRNSWFYWPKNVAAGNYFLKISTENGSISRPFSKM